MISPDKSRVSYIYEVMALMLMIDNQDSHCGCSDHYGYGYSYYDWCDVLSHMLRATPLLSMNASSDAYADRYLAGSSYIASASA